MSTTVTIKMTPKDFDDIRAELEFAQRHHRTEEHKCANDKQFMQSSNHKHAVENIERLLTTTLA